jgi:eukaryotic-like serine/threonine-protein kinase
MLLPMPERRLPSRSTMLIGAGFDTSGGSPLVQARLSLLGKTVFLLAFGFFAIMNGMLIVGGGLAIFPFLATQANLWHFLAASVMGVVWVITSFGSWSLRALGTLDATSLLLAGVCLALMAAQPDPFQLMAGLFSLAVTTMTRAVLIPSTAARTLCLSSMAAAPLLLASFLFHSFAPIPGFGLGFLKLLACLYAVLCLTIEVTLSTVMSHTIYGLRQQVRQASEIGQYTLEEKIGEGGMGVVYRATHAMLRRPAAIKLLLAERASEKDLARFEREVQQTSRLLHPNTISIFDYGRTADGTFYYVMEFLDGFDLECLVEAEGPLEASRVIHLLSQATGALVEAHGLGLVHRDIKPANIVLTERTDEADVVKVVDFGLVKSLSSSADDPAMTKADAITGTPLYLAPEAIAAPDSVDGRSDLYALGAVGYFLLTGAPVFEAKTVLEVCSKHLLETPVPPSVRLGRPMPADLEQLILACLAKAPTDRPTSAAALRQALEACAEATPHDAVAARRWWKERAATLRSRRKAEHHGDSVRPSEPQVTMAVDLRDRAPLPTAASP